MYDYAIHRVDRVLQLSMVGFVRVSALLVLTNSSNLQVLLLEH